MSNRVTVVGALLTGVVLGMLLLRVPIVHAANDLMFGSFNNAAKAVTVTSQGYINVVLH